MVYIQFNNKGFPHKIELVPGSQMKIAAELHDMFCSKKEHNICFLTPWMKPAQRVLDLVLK